MFAEMKGLAATAAVIAAAAVATPAADATPTQDRQIRALKAQVARQQAAIRARNNVIVRRGWEIYDLRTERDELQAAVTGTVTQQVATLPITDLWGLLSTIYRRFPTDPLAKYSATVITGGTYASYTFMRY